MLVAAPSCAHVSPTAAIIFTIPDNWQLDAIYLAHLPASNTGLSAEKLTTFEGIELAEAYMIYYERAPIPGTLMGSRV
ncbi:unnamed protein product [Peniophora sp. CBMAI 1063]|nr:unnamed protein product [Peniophora sp. CBMAI 1063]